MDVNHDLASIAALVGDPARARMLTALMSGIALTATELALEADVAPSTASEHLAKLTSARLLSTEKQGRHRYFRLADDDVGEMLEGLMTVATRHAPQQRVGPADEAMRHARVCYDHLAGTMGVALFDALKSRGIVRGRDAIDVTTSGERFLADFGVDLDALTHARRPLTRLCLDWSERRHHLAGSLGAAILQRVFANRWARRELDARTVLFTPAGKRAFCAHFGIP